MKSAVLALCLLLSLASGALAQERVAMLDPTGAPDLDVYLVLQRLVCPGAVVTGTFYEWRAVSQYRSNAGLHLGYDIAMPAGTKAVAGWPGQVTHVVQWSGPEYGITVLSPSGYETTYGHLTPRVKVGDVVNAGDTVGLVVNDHCDVKMRGPDGMYFDFGHSTPPTAGTFSMPGPARPTRADAMRSYQAAFYGAQLDQEQLKLAQGREQAAATELDEVRNRVKKSRQDLPKMKKYLADGLVARVEVQRAEADVHGGVAKVNGLQNKLREAQAEVAMRQARVRSMQAQMKLAAEVLAGMGVSKSELEKKVKDPASPQVKAQARELAQIRKRAATKGTSTPALAAAKANAERMQKLFEDGVVSRLERDRAKQHYEALLNGR